MSFWLTLTQTLCFQDNFEIFPFIQQQTCINYPNTINIKTGF